MKATINFSSSKGSSVSLSALELKNFLRFAKKNPKVHYGFIRLVGWWNDAENEYHEGGLYVFDRRNPTMVYGSLSETSSIGRWFEKLLWRLVQITVPFRDFAATKAANIRKLAHEVTVQQEANRKKRRKLRELHAANKQLRETLRRLYLAGHWQLLDGTPEQTQLDLWDEAKRRLDAGLPARPSSSSSGAPPVFEREFRYFLFKLSDLQKFAPEKIEELDRLGEEINRAREENGKEPIGAVVVENDWPEYEAVWSAIERRASRGLPTPAP